MARPSGLFAAAIAAQRGHLFPWVPVCLACGIGLYFALVIEPGQAMLWMMLGLGLCALIFGALARSPTPDGVRAPVIAAGLVALGFGLAGARSHNVAGPLVDFRYYGPVEGRVVDIDRSASDAVRLTLDRVVLAPMAPDETPTRVRVSLHGDQGFAAAAPGATVILTGHLGPPGGAVEPGGFDFRRHGWFLQLGAVGYTRTPVLLLAPPAEGQRIFKARMWLSERMRAVLPGETGAFAAAVTTGDRSAMGQATLQDLRDTNLAHLLAISGLHMGLLAGFVFGVLRLGLVALPWTRHRAPIKRIAALGALAAATGYLALSGGNVATERAYVMAAVALLAVVCDRRALSLRSVALAALIVLILRPEALTGPGFQMSFAATTALVATFEQVSRFNTRRERPLPRWMAPVLSLLVSSAVAGLATAPIGMAHFNTIAQFGLIANLVSVPVMGLVVVPAAVASALLMPLGLDWMALYVMGMGLDWILWVARSIASWDAAVRPVVTPGFWVLPLIALGGLMLCLLRGTARLSGALPLMLAAGLWSSADRPHVLIADDGGLVGILGPNGRALSRGSGGGFVADVWLENDGDLAGQEASALRWSGPIEGRIARQALGSVEFVHLQGKRAVEAFGRCAPGQIVVQSDGDPVPGDCQLFHPETLKQTGSVAVWLAEDGIRVVTDRQRTGLRLWHGARPDDATGLVAWLSTSESSPPADPER
ncbi:ComEC/Rec2 family competence protein [Citreimonas salinaria]|uniref:Competence protein ComEC n=1 Tax=Citreimonas salinaria TaxID=321339 RepID=A0A1H3G6P9_9RHOB|nr:ComEC/Rec2 family competence protein [Citreimonas salinaria]SDX98735.1 competence protein ComEC [Citreimonas salinaria]